MSAFLWPKPSYSIRSLARLPGANATSIEDALRCLFDTGFPVALSSARAGLVLTLTASGLLRPDLVKVPPYASHCLLEAVSRVATPLPAASVGRFRAEVVYHQWGYIQPHRTSNAELIEDACDTLCAPGARLFPLGGRFEIWSLPKILGCSSGGIVWCRDEGDAEGLRNLRDQRDSATFQWALRLLGSRWPTLAAYWEGRESACGMIPALAAADILSAVYKWDVILAARRDRLGLLERYTPAWLQTQNKDRLPCALPLQIDAKRELNFSSFGITTGSRHFERVLRDGSIELVEVLPIPLHHQCGIDTLTKVLETLKKHRYSVNPDS